MGDCEVMERLWSYLRSFSRMTKEMRPSHWVDVLAHALAYYGLKKNGRMCKYWIICVTVHVCDLPFTHCCFENGC